MPIYPRESQVTKSLLDLLRNYIFSSKANYARGLFLLFPLVFLAAGCNFQKKGPIHLCENVMTIDYHITIGDPLTEIQIKNAQKIIAQTFDEINGVFNKWNPDSEISRLNDLPALTRIQLSPALAQFFHRLTYFVQLSEGRFDPTIESIQEVWKRHLNDGTYPSVAELDEIKATLGWNKIHLENDIFYKEDSRTKLDFGGVAKGYGVDLIIERLQSIGIKNLYVEWGGEIRTIGIHPDQRPWRVFISRLGSMNPKDAIAEIDIIDKALATSGDYFQYWEATDGKGNKKTLCHIINPLTYSPMEIKAGSIASASLLASDCTMADALAKVLMLFDSPSEAHAWVLSLQLKHPEIICWISTRE